MILALAGGVGGAKLARGLANVLEPEALTIVVNTGDDFDHLGLTVCPDIDSVIYTMAGVNDLERGWGLAGESWVFMDALGRLGGETWFNLGDRDLATHVLRTQLLTGNSLSDTTRILAERNGLRHLVAPMSDQPVRSFIETDEGRLAFQDYFVRLRAEPVFRAIAFEGAEAAQPSPALIAALEDPGLEAIIVCPSNPVLSISPILAVPGARARLEQRTAPLVVVSPFIGGKALKGPAAKIFSELGLSADAAGLASIYGDLCDGLVIDSGEERVDFGQSLAVLATDTLIGDLAAQARLAEETLSFAHSLSAKHRKT